MERGPSTLAAALPCVPRGNCALTTGTNYREEIRIRFSSGAYRWILSRASPLYDSSTGAISGWLGIVSDIQESKENEERLVEQANFTNRFLDSSEDCIEVLDLDGNIVAIINPGRRLLKIPDTIDPRGTFSPEWWSEPQHQQAAQHALEAARRGETERFAGMMEIEGRRRWFDAVAWSILGETGLPERVLMVSRDITEKRHADKALERVAQGLLLLSRTGAAVRTHDDRITRGNVARPSIHGFAIGCAIDIFDESGGWERIVAHENLHPSDSHASASTRVHDRLLHRRVGRGHPQFRCRSSVRRCGWRSWGRYRRSRRAKTCDERRAERERLR